MNTVFIIPTGIGCKIGGHAGDANPAFKLIASVSNIAITHPNVVNASDLNEMPDNTWYVEGSILDRFLEGTIALNKPKSNRILLVTNSPIANETINAVNAARYTLGCFIEILELNTPLRMIAKMEGKKAGGDVYGWEELISQVRECDFDALAIATRIDCPPDIALNYFREGGINPWGGIEAKTSKLIANALNIPVAHAPVETLNEEVASFGEIVNPRMAAEVISQCYLHCILKGLHKAPRLSLNESDLWASDIDCLITPNACFGRPHMACLKANIPIIVVCDNTTMLNRTFPDNPLINYASNYLEAVGIICCMKEGIFTKYVKSDE